MADDERAKVKREQLETLLAQIKSTISEIDLDGADEEIYARLGLLASCAAVMSAYLVDDPPFVIMGTWAGILMEVESTAIQTLAHFQAMMN